MAAGMDEPTPAATKRHGSETSSESPLSSAVSSASSSSSSSCSSSSCGPPPPPESTEELPRRSITRKRAASIDTEEANRPLVESLSLNTPSTASPRSFDGSRERICLCTPAPKVPRPRNGTSSSTLMLWLLSFILYRQHHQAQVVQQHPGLANPEISKIIGEQWRAEPEEAKNQWKLLAEEEKQRHQRQHPDYRAHSPRPTPAAPGEDPHRCSKCGGRYIATPRTPSTPFMTPTVSRMASTPYGHLPPSLGHHTRGSKGDMSRNGRSHPAPQWSSTQNALSLYDIHENYEPAMSSNEAKRRRYNTPASYHNAHALSSPPTPFPQPDHQQHQAPHSSYPRRPSLSNPATPAAITYPAPPLLGPSAMVPPRSSPGPMMPPPPRPSRAVPVSGTVSTTTSASTAAHYDTNPTAMRLCTPSTNRNINANNYHQHYPGDSGGGFDESLRLPPLQTQQLSATSPDDNNNNSNDNNEPAASTASASVSATAATGLRIIHPTPTISSYGAARITGEGEEVVKKERERERDAAAAAERAMQARSVEAMVMSISFVSKLRVLERISPPLGAGAGAGSFVIGPGSGFSSGSNRGPVIAVEGPNASFVRAVSRVVMRALRAASPAAADEKGGGGWEVKCWEDENSSTFTSPCGPATGVREDVAMGDDGLSNAVSHHGSQLTSVIDSPSVDVNPFTAYLRTIADWHAKSAEIVQFVTSQTTSTSISTPTPTPTQQTRVHFMSSAGSITDSNNNDNSNNNRKAEPEEQFESTPRLSHHRRGSLLPGDSAADAPTTSKATTTSTSRPTNTNAKANNKLPIALLPSGFALTLSDRFASIVPISDAYAPVDHWQWMATLWRGIVGADLVIYVVAGGTNNNNNNTMIAAEDGHPGSGGSGGIGPVDGTVEIRSGGLIIVKVPSPSAGGSGGGGSSSSRHGNAEVEGMVDEKMERRLGFEVVEWVRSGGWVNAGRGGGGCFGMEY
ncbi:hypothetical protein P885DRAFT_70333 [Corynascus similis CBS 632.67]